MDTYKSIVKIIYAVCSCGIFPRRGGCSGGKKRKKRSCRYEVAGFNKTNTGGHKLAVQRDGHVVTAPARRGPAARAHDSERSGARKAERAEEN